MIVRDIFAIIGVIIGPIWVVLQIINYSSGRFRAVYFDGFIVKPKVLNLPGGVRVSFSLPGGSFEEISTGQYIIKNNTDSVLEDSSFASPPMIPRVSGGGFFEFSLIEGTSIASCKVKESDGGLILTDLLVPSRGSLRFRVLSNGIMSDEIKAVLKAGQFRRRLYSRDRVFTSAAMPSVALTLFVSVPIIDSLTGFIPDGFIRNLGIAGFALSFLVYALCCGFLAHLAVKVQRAIVGISRDEIDFGSESLNRSGSN